MKKTIKKLKLLSYICLAMFLLNSCTQEKEFVNEHNHRDIDFKEKSFKEALSLPLFNDALQKVAKQKGALRSEDAARTALEDQYGFTIVTDAPIRIITDENGTVSYTILIEREVKEELKFENLMIKVEDEETTAAIFKYTLTEKGEISETGDYPIKGISNTVFTDLNVEGKVFYNSNGDTCFDWFAFQCDDVDPTHTAYATCFANNTAYPVIIEVCIQPSPNLDPIGVGGGGETGGTDGGGTPDGSSNNTGGLGGSGGNNTTVSLSPINCKTGNCIEMDVILPDPCAMLKKLQADTNFKNRMSLLLTAARTYSFEKLHVLYNADIIGPTNNFSYANFSGTIQKPEANYTGNTSMLGVIHSHYGQLLSIFSAVDLQDLYFKLKNHSDITDDIFLGLVTSSNTAYILQVQNRAAFIAFGDVHLADDDKKEKLMKIMLDKYGIKPTADRDTNELGFLRMMKQMNLGLTLASSNSFNYLTPTSASLFDTWTKKEYNPATNNINTSNCN